MFRLRESLVAIAALLLYVAPGISHHSFAPVYDAKRMITVKGVVTQFKFVNPHAMMFMNVTDDAGKIVKWTIEFAGSLNLSNVGWTAETIKAGEQVTVTGNPTHIGSARMFFLKLVRPDGTEVLPADAQRSGAIEEERRQRAKARDQQK
jgi:hypothetical protein